MCAGESRRLWTDGDWRDDMRQWAATWQRRPGLEWSAAALMRLPEEPARAAVEGLQTNQVALLVCGGGGYAAVSGCLRRCYPLVRRGGIVLVEEYYKHGGSRRATDELLARHSMGRRAAAAVPTYAVGEQTRPRFGFSQQVRPAEALSFAEVGRLQVLAANVSDETHPLLQRSDRCCNAERMDDTRCCRPHAMLWQVP